MTIRYPNNFFPKVFLRLTVNMKPNEQRTLPSEMHVIVLYVYVYFHDGHGVDLKIFLLREVQLYKDKQAGLSKVIRNTLMANE